MTPHPFCDRSRAGSPPAIGDLAGATGTARFADPVQSDRRLGVGAGVLGRRGPAEVCLVVAIQRRTAAGVARVEEEILHVDRDELQRAAGFVEVRAARDLFSRDRHIHALFYQVYIPIIKAEFDLHARMGPHEVQHHRRQHAPAKCD